MAVPINIPITFSHVLTSKSEQSKQKAKSTDKPSHRKKKSKLKTYKMGNIKLADIDDFCRRMKIDAKTKIDIALLVELLDKFADEQIAKSLALRRLV